MKRLVFYGVIITFILITLLTVNAEIISDEGRLPFKDVKESAWYHDAVAFSYLNGYMSGTSGTAMAPHSPLTREAAVAILARMSGDDLSEFDTESIFADVKSGLWYTREVNWAYAKGYISGMTPDSFGVGRSMTREQFARVLWLYLTDRYGEGELTDTLGSFRDINTLSDWAYEAMSYCVSKGLINGTSADTLSPRTLLTRAQMAVLVKNITLEYSQCTHKFSQPKCTTPSYCYYCNLKNALPKGHRCDALSCYVETKCSSCSYRFPADPNSHVYTQPSCTAASSCKNCGAKGASALGHSYTAATCTKPKTCTRCKTTQGKALGHTSYNQACSRCKSFNYRTKILSVPYIDQRQNWPNGCEAVSTVMALRYYGVDITVNHFIDGYLPTGSAPKNGYGSDPNEVYCGDPYSTNGWGCFSPAIVKALKSLLVPQYWTIEHSYSYTLPDLCDRYIDKNNPVIIWATVDMKNSSSYAYWYTEEGKRISYNRYLHCLVLVGYDKDNYYFNDPMRPGNGSNYVAYPKDKAETAYKLLGQQSIAFYYKDN